MRKIDESRADVAVVGGGVAGLSAARELARRGLSVVVLDGGASGAASLAAAGMLAPQAEADRADEFFKLLCASREMYPAFADALFEESGVDIELERTGTLYLALTEEDEREVEQRFAWQTRGGLEVERLTAEEARALEPQVSPRVRLALRFPRDWQVENRRLVEALAASGARLGVRVLNETEARGVRVAAGRAEGVESSREFIAAGAVILAAGAHTSRVQFLNSESKGAEARELENEGHEDESSHPRVEPVRGQMLCLQQSPAPFVRHVVYSPRAYLVPRRDGRLLAGSTSERGVSEAVVTAGGLQSIAAGATEIAPRVASLAVKDSWAGLRPRAAGDLPLIGESADAKNLFYATGYYRNGILLAPAAGELVAALVTGGTTRLPSGLLEAFAPSRRALALAAPRDN